MDQKYGKKSSRTIADYAFKHFIVKISYNMNRKTKEKFT